MRNVRDAFARGADIDLGGPVPADLLAELLTGEARPRAALRLRNARITGRLDLRHAEITAPVSIVDCVFAEAPELSEARAPNLLLSGCTLPGLNARLLELRGDLRLRDCTVTGPVVLSAAQIGGDADLDGTTITVRPAETNGLALVAERIAVAGSLLARYGFTADGGVALLHARVDNQLNFMGATLRADDQVAALHLGGARAGSVWLTFAAPPQGRLQLAGLDADTLFDDPDTWPSTVDLIGCRYRMLIGRRPAPRGAPAPDQEVSVRTRLEWLRRESVGFVPQPYEQLADFYRRSGRDADARRVLLARNRRHRATLGPAGRAAGYVADALVGYGYRTWYAALWLAGLWGLGTLALRREKEPPLLALDLLLPVINLGRDDTWRPSGTTAWVSALLVISGWILTTAVVAGLTRQLSR
ncbi:hypothetical protein Val02_60470 [Virgisporangium aliadipatigenens]|uniref:Oxidoreductase n=1 Tax=Virgisporangium aliadipatigenens TaxID=741659 RepID=A0A8J3YSS5_9ACTN|nr:hypothetical protein [Virgisporangium aliadipatigenens]GIJ49161.1 hypothetical protein Val02_60470 [Virgisporangium aliadipatigenens]